MSRKDNKVIKVISKSGKNLGKTTLEKAMKLVLSNGAYWTSYKESIRLTSSREEFKAMRLSVLKEEEYTCYICGNIIEANIATVDHVIPKAKLGSDERENLRCCCKSCNKDKKDKDIIDYCNYILNNLQNYNHLDKEKIKKLKTSFFKDEYYNKEVLF